MQTLSSGMMHGCLSAHTMQPLKRNIFAQESGVKDRRRKGGQSCMHHPVKESKGNNGRWCTITTLSFIILGERGGWREGKKTLRLVLGLRTTTQRGRLIHPPYILPLPCSCPLGSSKFWLSFLSLSLWYPIEIMPSHKNQPKSCPNFKILVRPAFALE